MVPFRMHAIRPQIDPQVGSVLTYCGLEGLHSVGIENQYDFHSPQHPRFRAVEDRDRCTCQRCLEILRLYAKIAPPIDPS